MGINKIQATVQESLLQHLYNKATGRTDSTTLKFNIPECDLYGDEPCKIWSDHYRHGTSSTTTTTTLLLTGNNKSNKNNMKKNEELYVFTKLKKKSVKGTRFDRTVGDKGAWKGEDSGVKIYCDDNPSALDTETATPPIRVHGVKKRYRYESSSKSVNDDGRWIMYEYSLDASMLPHAKFPDYVLCRIKKNDEPEKKRKAREAENARKMKENEDDQGKKPEHIQKKTKVVSLETQENKQLEPICNNNNNNNNNNGIPSATTTTTNPSKVAAIDAELQHVSNRVTIDLTNDDDHGNSASEDVVVVNNIGTTLVGKQLDSKDSLPEKLAIESPKVDESLEEIDWDIAFAEELLEGQSQPMQEPGIEMLLNLLFHEDWLGAKVLK